MLAVSGSPANIYYNHDTVNIPVPLRHGDSFVSAPEVTRAEWAKITNEWRCKKRIDKAQERALEGLDYVLETIQAPDFVEIIGRMGGDAVTYWVGDDGSMYERCLT